MKQKIFDNINNEYISDNSPFLFWLHISAHNLNQYMDEFWKLKKVERGVKNE